MPKGLQGRKLKGLTRSKDGKFKNFKGGKSEKGSYRNFKKSLSSRTKGKYKLKNGKTRVRTQFGTIWEKKKTGKWVRIN